MEIISFDGRRKNIGSDKFEVNNEHEILNRWESLSVDDMIFTANCIKAAGVRNFKEFRIWEKNNPDKGLARFGTNVKIFKKK